MSGESQKNWTTRDGRWKREKQRRTRLRWKRGKHEPAGAARDGTRDKLAGDRVRSQAQAIQTHEQVGKEVRDAIKRIGGILPENIPPAEHIKEVKKRAKTAIPKLTLDEREAGGLLGDAVDKRKDK
jgi:hypothetical protein